MHRALPLAGLVALVAAAAAGAKSPPTLRVALAPWSFDRQFAHGTTGHAVLYRSRLTVDIRAMDPERAVRLFRRGELEEAPVPPTEIGAWRGRRALRVRRLQLFDVVTISAAVPRRLRDVYGLTAARGDYVALMFDDLSPTIETDPAAYRRAVRAIDDLPKRRVRIAVPDDPTLQYGARILYAQWRDLGLGPVLVGDNAPADARLARVAHAPKNAIPIARVVDARLVSSRVLGWHEDALGRVDYAAIRFRAPSRRP